MLVECIVRCERPNPELIELDGIYRIDIHEAAIHSPYLDLMIDSKSFIVALSNSIFYKIKMCCPFMKTR